MVIDNALDFARKRPFSAYSLATNNKEGRYK
jgi:hypothetical protein